MKKYKCKDCEEETNILTLGEIFQGCANCGGHSGFWVRIKGVWKNYK